MFHPVALQTGGSEGQFRSRACGPDTCGGGFMGLHSTYQRSHSTNPGEARLAGRHAGSAYDVTGAVVVDIDMHFVRQAIVQLDRGVPEARIRLQ
jgi:hypothetical protein